MVFSPIVLEFYGFVPMITCDEAFKNIERLHYKVGLEVSGF